MNSEEFVHVLTQQIHVCEDVLIDKARQYANDKDRLHNFRVAAALEDVSMRQALAGMMAKHTVSIYDLCRATENVPMEIWSEKITDHLNYLIILRAIVQEELQETEDDNLVLSDDSTYITPVEVYKRDLRKYRNDPK